ncbi:aspartyl-tRNA synthetase, partial [Trifolium medium]|nr:aspartyl-tRNA synthetase [Trifolium medium]
MNENGRLSICDKKLLSASDKKTYMKHHKLKDIIVGAISHDEYYELFKMEEDEDIETMFSMFQTLISGLKVLKKSYTTYDHVGKIMRNLPQQWRPKVTAIEEAKDLKKLSLESVISNLRSHEMVLNADVPLKNSKLVALQSTKTSSKALKAKLVEIEEESSVDGQEEE